MTSSKCLVLSKTQIYLVHCHWGVESEITIKSCQVVRRLITMWFIILHWGRWCIVFLSSYCCWYENAINWPDLMNANIINHLFITKNLYFNQHELNRTEVDYTIPNETHRMILQKCLFPSCFVFYFGWFLVILGFGRGIKLILQRCTGAMEALIGRPLGIRASQVLFKMIQAVCLRPKAVASH